MSNQNYKRRVSIPLSLYKQAQNQAAFRRKWHDKPRSKQTTWQDVVRYWLTTGAEVDPTAEGLPAAILPAEHDRIHRRMPRQPVSGPDTGRISFKSAQRYLKKEYQLDVTITRIHAWTNIGLVSHRDHRQVLRTRRRFGKQWTSINAIDGFITKLGGPNRIYKGKGTQNE